MQYYALWYRLDLQDSYLIWGTGESETDSLSVDEDGYLLSFESLDRVALYARKRNIEISLDDPSVYDLDWLEVWISDREAPLDCVCILNAWNLFSDISHSVRYHRESFLAFDREYSDIYDKVFGWNDLLAITPKGQKYKPNWSLHEENSVRDLMMSGMIMFRQNLRTRLTTNP